MWKRFENMRKKRKELHPFNTFWVLHGISIHFVGWVVGLDQNRGKNWLGSEKNWLVMGFVVMGEMIFMRSGLNWLGSENLLFLLY